jgi:hypothetical protein
MVHGHFQVPALFVTNAGNTLRQRKAEQLSEWLKVKVILLIFMWRDNNELMVLRNRVTFSHFEVFNSYGGSPWSWSYGRWIYNYRHYFQMHLAPVPPIWPENQYKGFTYELMVWFGLWCLMPLSTRCLPNIKGLTGQFVMRLSFSCSLNCWTHAESQD